jgi:hypothetical protein
MEEARGSATALQPVSWSSAAKAPRSTSWQQQRQRDTGHAQQLMLETQLETCVSVGISLCVLQAAGQLA